MDFFKFSIFIFYFLTLKIPIQIKNPFYFLELHTYFLYFLFFCIKLRIFLISNFLQKKIFFKNLNLILKI